MNRLFSILLVLVVCGTACRDATPVRIGVKPFAEQEILAAATNELLRAEGLRTTVPYVCEDTFDCHRALQAGRIDLMVEYSGTALHLAGVRAEPEQAWATLERLYEPLGLVWSEPLGFDNGYRWIVTSAQARMHGLSTISDLARVGRLRVATPAEYRFRPRDGLAATAERHGLQLAEPVVIRDPSERYQALVDGRVDAAVGYGTDGALGEWPLAVLRDELGFFPPYEAAYLVRRDALKEHPGLDQVLARLVGRLDEDRVRRLNRAVEVEGRTAASVARRFLADEKLLEGRPSAFAADEFVVAVDPADRLAHLTPRVQRAVREVFSDRVVEVNEQTRPLERLARREARLAIVGAEAFFHTNGRGELSRDMSAEAVAVMGSRMLHIVVRKDAISLPDNARVGVRASGSAARVAQSLAQARGFRTERAGSLEAMLEDVAAGRLDAVALFAVEGREDLVEQLAHHDLRLTSAQDWLSDHVRFAFPYLRRAMVRLPGHEEQEPVETVAMQLLLAGPARSGSSPSHAHGPAAGLSSEARPLTYEEVEAVRAALGAREAPDPSLPSIYSIDASARERRSDATPSLIDSLLNLGVFAFLGWLVFVVTRPRRARDEVAGADGGL